MSDLTNRDTKTLQLALLLALTCHCTVPCKRLRGSPPAALHLLLKVELQLNIGNPKFHPNVNSTEI